MPEEDGLKDSVTGQMTVVGVVLHMASYILLTFFVVEIVLKLFAYAHIFLMSVMNVIFSIVVIISFVFYILDLRTKGIGLLRLLLLTKLIIELKRIWLRNHDKNIYYEYTVAPDKIKSFR